MSQWRSEIALNIRYGVGGLLNTAVGLGAIGIFTLIGFNPLGANFAGYALGLTVAFLISRRYVFRSNGSVKHESIRYVVAFCLCYLINILVLQMCISMFGLDVLIAQGFSVAAYVVSMYLATRFCVF